MTKFYVTIKEVHSAEVEVEAENEAAAIEAAENLINSDEVETTYSYTMDSDEWNVERAQVTGDEVDGTTAEL